MDVRISYGINIEEVPSKIECIGKLSEFSNSCSLAKRLLAEGGEHSETALKIIDSARENMSLIDRRLSDVYMILSGFVSAKDELENPSSAPDDTEATNVS